MGFRQIRTQRNGPLRRIASTQERVFAKTVVEFHAYVLCVCDTSPRKGEIRVKPNRFLKTRDCSQCGFDGSLFKQITASCIGLKCGAAGGRRCRQLKASHVPEHEKRESA